LIVIPGVSRREIAIGKPGCQNGFSFLPVQGKTFGLPVFLVPGQASQRKPSKIDCTLASVLRSTSVSSRRSTMVPLLWRAKSQLKMNVRALPTCK
jgi:hypothetical protein